MKFYNSTQFGALLSINPQTLRVWEKKGLLIPHHKSFGGHRYYSDEQLTKLINSDNSQK